MYHIKIKIIGTLNDKKKDYTFTDKYLSQIQSGLLITMNVHIIKQEI